MSGFRAVTAARIGLARSGPALSTAAMLEVRLAHALARDAVHAALDEAALIAQLDAPVVVVSSRAGDRQTYLMRPDLGRLLSEEAEAVLAGHAGAFELAITMADGLSATAVQRQAAPLLAALLPLLRGWRVAPLVLIWNGRVKASDGVAGALGAGAVLALIGERPGLSAPDSLGAYLTWAPGPETLDSARNCVSNIRPEGLPHQEAARRLHHLLEAMRSRGLSGVGLKDESEGVGLL